MCNFVSLLFINLLTHSTGQIVHNPSQAEVLSDSTVRVNLHTAREVVVRYLHREDPDRGPYCHLDTTTNSFMTGDIIYSNYVVTSDICEKDCSIGGCSFNGAPTESGLKSLPRGSNCTVAGAYHYSEVGSASETRCPFWDPSGSTFLYGGQPHQMQWFWLGWPTREDCMKAFMCGPTSVYLDETQTSSKFAWCLPTPIGWYSRTCDNGVARCSVPEHAGDMSLAYWTSHGYGSSTGCGLRLVSPAALVDGIDLTPVISGSVFSISFQLNLKGPIVEHSRTILFGVLPVFLVAVFGTAPGAVRIVLYHKKWTVTDISAELESADVDWKINQVSTVSIASDGSSIYIGVNDELVSRFDQVASTRSIGDLAIPTLPSNFTTMVHVGPAYVTESDFVNSTTKARSPYSASTAGQVFELSNLGFSENVVDHPQYRQLQSAGASNRSSERTAFIVLVVILVGLLLVAAGFIGWRIRSYLRGTARKPSLSATHWESVDIGRIPQSAGGPLNPPHLNCSINSIPTVY